MTPLPSSRPKVFIITWCRFPERLYGSLLTFRTLRTGFPDSEVLVVENASPPPFRHAIREAAEAAGCRFFQMEVEEPHWSLMEQFAMAEDGPCVFLDPDLVFWEKVSDWSFGDALMAGRRLPAFADPFSSTYTLARLHSSHLWFPDPPRLRARLGEILRGRFEVGSLFEPRMLPPGWWRWDTAAVLYHALGSEAVAFSEAQLDGYDHLFCGSHVQIVLPNLPADQAALLEDSHARAQGDLASLKGVWRLQERFFAARPWSGRVEAPSPAEASADVL